MCSQLALGLCVDCFSALWVRWEGTKQTEHEDSEPSLGAHELSSETDKDKRAIRVFRGALGIQRSESQIVIMGMAVIS